MLTRKSTPEKQRRCHALNFFVALNEYDATHFYNGEEVIVVFREEGQITDKYLLVMVVRFAQSPDADVSQTLSEMREKGFCLSFLNYSSDDNENSDSFQQEELYFLELVSTYNKLRATTQRWSSLLDVLLPQLSIPTITHLCASLLPRSKTVRNHQVTKTQAVNTLKLIISSMLSPVILDINHEPDAFLGTYPNKLNAVTTLDLPTLHELTNVVYEKPFCVMRSLSNTLNVIACDTVIALVSVISNKKLNIRSAAFVLYFAFGLKQFKDTSFLPIWAFRKSIQRSSLCLCF